MAVRPLTTSGTAPKASRSAPKNTAKAATRQSAPLPAGEDESGDDIDFDAVDTAPAKPAKASTADKRRASLATAPKPAAAPKASKAKGGTKTITFVLEKETPGAGQYCEIDGDGNKLGIKEACMGKPYLRKDQVGGVLPKKFTAVITW